jgi:hypothetical protein
MKYAYQNLKSNSKRRGKAFELTFEEFSEFAIEVDYLKKKGITSTSLHVDRIDENKGYTRDNIQGLENSKNVRKWLIYHYNGVAMEFETKTTKPQIIKDVPF